ncbi:type II toxin-antitoxin system HipA family toxin [Pleionea mediterranea]|uniref:Serine/threonine-protein kinase HipA n=1 Tax=Pleionea mediterranea TaxID=523701 RepID=A0A316FR13_9GAMM|nr:type II toxin-antitoxin system HipA family toxin [Pleionea mediterranea]PWK50100.1 serine/threonine-protein kinase HipA [Pleionea mediterranea]
MVTQQQSEARVEVADVVLWGEKIAAVAWNREKGIADFQYRPEFLKQNTQPAPLTMPLSDRVYQFAGLNKDTYFGLPGLLADSLPDKFGNALIDAWLAKQGRSQASFSPIERLCYMGNRGMGALEFQPSTRGRTGQSHRIEIDTMVSLANDVLSQRQSLMANIEYDRQKEKAFEDIIRIGTSAGGARAKAIVAWDQQSNEIRSGQITAPDSFSYWILKFDGIQHNRDKELNDPQGFGRVEYAYYLMAKDCGITMMDSHLLQENGRAHFITKRFDRFDNGDKLHVQSLCAINHLDFNMAGAHSYEQAFSVMDKLELSKDDKLQQFKRMVFNAVTRNQDDHTKNIAYVMNKAGKWRLSPAFDVCFSYNPDGLWTAQHQMSINGKRDNFQREDLLAVAKIANIKKQDAEDILEQILSITTSWLNYANKADVDNKFANYILSTFRLRWFE